MELSGTAIYINVMLMNVQCHGRIIIDNLFLVSKLMVAT